MTRRRHLRVAISVEPTILGEALVCVLHQAGVDEVVNLGATLRPPRAAAGPAYDAAVVSVALPDDVEAEVVIELPPTPMGTGAAALTVRGHRRPVEINELGDILRLLDADYDAG